ncbi:MAG: hypothetical protein RIB45_06600 [Marivibrio sp.]|uniref:hypothetical protein n=1 Tax=Marivibrio sp. TaxID=2039719 RepID=UPI0032EEC9FD
MEGDRPYPWNEMFSRIVAGEGETRSLLAYALYKQLKVEWTEREQGNRGGPISLHDMNQFRESVDTDTQINMLFNEADRRLEDYARQLLGEQQATELVDAYEGGKKDEMNKQLQALNSTVQGIKAVSDNLQTQANRSFLMAVLASLLGSAFAFVIAVAAFFAWSDWIAELFAGGAGG